MTEKLNITGAELEKSYGAEAKGIWRNILLIGQYGDIPFGHEGGLDLSSLDDGKRAQIYKLISTESPTNSAKKDGK